MLIRNTIFDASDARSEHIGDRSLLQNELVGQVQLVYF